MTILVLCRESNLCNTLGFYAQAFRRHGVRLVCAAPEFPWNGRLDAWLRLCPERPSLIWHPEADVPFLPWGLTSIDIPTASFQVDTYAYTRRRISWSMLFDLVLVFHPGYDVKFREAGHPGAHLMPHAVEAEFFLGQTWNASTKSGGWARRRGRFIRRVHESWRSYRKHFA